MLDVKRNRLNYGELISPPEGFELTKAIGTTYTLDLYALLAIVIIQSRIFLLGHYSHHLLT